VYLYYVFGAQSRGLRAVQLGILRVDSCAFVVRICFAKWESWGCARESSCLGLIMVYVYYEFAARSKGLRAAQMGICVLGW
jgi:hypothetical protein